MKELKIFILAAVALSISFAANAQSKWGDAPEELYRLLRTVASDTPPLPSL